MSSKGHVETLVEDFRFLFRLSLYGVLPKYNLISRYMEIKSNL